MPTVVAALVAVGAVLASAKPPPFLPGAAPGAPGPGPSPWAAYASKAGPLAGRSLVGLGAPMFADDGAAPAWGAADPDDPPVGLGAGFGGPLSPFLKLKPFLPVKPTFMPPVVDPSKFIDMKASILNSLFPAGLPAATPLAGAAPPAYSGVSARALFGPYAAPDAPVASPAVKPPPPAFLADLFKALNINKTVANATGPAAAYPAPAYPAPVFPYPGAAPAAPIVDPGVFISMKAKFLSDLFAGLATTTPAPPPPPTEAATPDPAALNAELAASLQRLLDSLASPVNAPEGEQGTAAKAKRAADSAALVADAKDKAVDTIIGELVVLKNGMVGAVTDLAATEALAQKAADAAAAAAAPKKPLSPYAALWAKPSATAVPTKPAPAVEPVRQKVVLLGQVFDMLTDMERDIAGSMTVPAATAATEAESAATDGLSAPTAAPSLADLVQAKISQLVAQSNASSAPAVAVPLSSSATNRTSPSPTGSKTLRLAGAAPAPAGPPVDPTFWIPDTAVVGPDAYLAKTKEFLSSILAAKSTPSPIVRRSYKPAYYPQQPQDQQGSQPQPSQQQWPSPGPQQAKIDLQRVPPAAAAAIAYQLQHHHHHNRQPYWWN